MEGYFLLLLLAACRLLLAELELWIQLKTRKNITIQAERITPTYS